MKYCLKYWRKLLFLILLAMMSAMAKAQSNFSFYSFDDQFNSSDYNPAFLTSSQKFTFTIFPIGGTSFGYNNQAEIRNMISQFLDGISTDNDYQKVFERMTGQTTFHQNLESSLLSFTYRSNIGFFNFRIKECESFSASVEGDLTKFIFKPEINSAFIDQVQHLPLQILHYREFSLGYSYKSRMNRFSAGIRAKMYFGKSAFYSGVSGSIKEESDDFVFRTWGLVNMSFPDAKVLNPDGTQSIYDNSESKIMNYFFNKGNPGFGVDLGIKYSINPKLTFSMSAIDLGKISWKTNLNSKYFNGECLIPNNTITKSTTDQAVQIITKTLENYSYSDSVAEMFNLTIDRSTFARPLPLTIYTGMKYRLSTNLSISLTDRYVKVKDMDFNSFSVTANYNVNKELSVSTGYSAIGDSYINLPLAFLLKKKYGQIYIGTDNLVSILVPSFTNYAGLSFGACFYLFTKRDLYWKPSDELPFYKPRKIKKNKKNGQILKAFT